MSFFEPLPPQPPSSEHHWGPPLWDRPSEGTIPAVFAVNALVHRTNDAAVAIGHLGVYPNGFTINVAMLGDPHKPRFGPGAFGYGDPTGRFPRIGVRFSNGRTAGRAAGHPDRSRLAKDEQGVPTEPFIGGGGGGGGMGAFHFGVWVFPLPPDGPLEIFVAVPGMRMVEESVTVDGAAVRAAAQSAHVIWT
jgi:hypothetical protein